MKKIFFISFLVIILFVLCFIKRDFVVWCFSCKPNFSKNATIIDYSIQKRNETNNTYKVHLVTYASGREVYYRNQNTLLQTAINKGFDVFHLYNEKHLDPAFREKNKHVLGQKRGAGYWLWKPYVILDTLKHADEGDVIIYVDSGILLEKNINDILSKIDSMSSDIILLENGHSNRAYIKRDLMKFFDMDNEEYRNRIHIDAAFIILKNTRISRAFIRKWLSCCESGSLITDEPSKEKEYEDFKDNRHDQAILTLVSYKYPEGISVIPNDLLGVYYHHHRRRERKKDFSLFKDAYTK